MKRTYELDEREIRGIIAEKIGCKQDDVYIRCEKEHVLGGTTESIKATIKLEG